MLDVNLLREEPERVREGIAAKNAPIELVDQFLRLDKEWRGLVSEVDALRAKQNRLGKDQREEARQLKQKLREKEKNLIGLGQRRLRVLEQIPNLPAPDVPRGKDETANVVLKEVGERLMAKGEFKPKDYLVLADGLIDTERAAKVSGSRFGYLFGDLVLLEFALVKLALDRLRLYNFIPVVPPVLIGPEAMRGMGKVKFIEDKEAFYLPEDNLYLVGSAEHSIGPIHMNEVLDYESLPRRYVGFSTSFRREAGSYGKDTRGILRVHQFDKVEMFSFTRPELSEEEHQFLLARQEEFMQELNLPYRVVQICTGDMGFTDYKQYDIEAWLPGEGRYRETHSCSNTTDFQARGVNVKYRLPHSNETAYVHMLNATAFAIGRMLIAIIENYQTEEGKVVVPEVLREYVGKSEIEIPAS
jgi:seryl-tRNA synthetase